MARSNREREAKLLSTVRPEYTRSLRIPRQDIDTFAAWAVDAIGYLPLPREAKLVMEQVTSMSRGLPDAIIDVPLRKLIDFIVWAESAQAGCPATDEQLVLIKNCKQYRDSVIAQQERVKSAVRDYWAH